MYKILIADDEQAIVSLLSDYLKLNRYEVLVAYDGNEAVKQALKGPDLILLEPHGGHPFLAIEMKSGKGRQTEYQKQYEAILKKVGAEYFVVRSLDEFIKIINNYLKQ